MLFDPSFFAAAAALFPDLQFHVIGAGKTAASLHADNIVVHPELAFADTLGYLQHAAFGVAPYRDADAPRYLIDTSLKLRQFALFGIPAVCPVFALGEAKGRFGYTPGDRRVYPPGPSTRPSPARSRSPTPRCPGRRSWTGSSSRRPIRTRGFDRSRPKPVVAIYRTEVLPLSETFVRDQARALRRWQPVLVGERRIDALPLSDLAVATCHAGPADPAAASGRARLAQLGPGLAVDHRPGATDRSGPDPRAFRLRRRRGLADRAPARPAAAGHPARLGHHHPDGMVRQTGRAGRRWTGYPSRLARLAMRPEVSFVAISENIRRAALAAGLPPERVFVERIGIDTALFAPSGLPVARREPVILFLGRLVEKKGCRFLIEAFRALRAAVPRARLVVAGDGPERASLEALAADLDAVRFVGAASHPQVQALLRDARVFCLPSITAESGDAEGLPLVVLEAQASGVPVVTSARGGV